MKTDNLGSFQLQIFHPRSYVIGITCLIFHFSDTIRNITKRRKLDKIQVRQPVEKISKVCELLNSLQNLKQYRFDITEVYPR